jgi:hypothetical protein
MHVGRLVPGAAFTIVAVALAVSGCGSSKKETSPAVAWADGVCSAVTTYKTSLETTATIVKKGTFSKSELNDAADSVKDATQTFATTVQDLGAPDTPSGQTIKETIDGLASSLGEVAQTIEDATSGTVLSAVSTVSTALVTAQGQITTALDQLKKADAKGELQDAFSKAPACSAFDI